MYLPRPPQRSQPGAAPAQRRLTFNVPAPPQRSVPNAAEKARSDDRASSRLLRHEENLQRSPGRRKVPNKEVHKALLADAREQGPSSITNAPAAPSSRGKLDMEQTAVGGVNYRIIGQQARRDRERHQTGVPSAPPSRDQGHSRQDQDTVTVEEGQSPRDDAKNRNEEDKGIEGEEEEKKDEKDNVEGEEKVTERLPLPESP